MATTHVGVDKNIFTGGMDKDSSKYDFKPNKYYDALNMKMITNRGLSSGGIQNEDGNRILFKIPNTQKSFQITSNKIGAGYQVTINSIVVTMSADVVTITDAYDEIIDNVAIATAISDGDFGIYSEKDRITIIGFDTKLNVISSDFIIELFQDIQEDLGIVGWEYVAEHLVVFTTPKTNIESEPTDTSGQIWVVPFNKTTATITSGYVDSDNYLILSKTLIYNNGLNFSLKNRIQIEVFYKKDDVVKVYWTDTYNNLRHINIFDPDSFAIKPTDLDMILDVSLSTPTIKEVLAGGNLQSGVVQYAYQLYSLDGGETIFSPATLFVHLTEASETASDSRGYYGTDHLESSNKSIRVEFNLNELDYDFEYIRVISLHYLTKHSVPIINIIADQSLPDRDATSTDLLFVIDDGLNYLGSYTFQEYTQVGTKLFSCQAIASKDNMLFAENTKETILNLDNLIDWDSRAYRWNPSRTQAKITGRYGGVIDIDYNLLATGQPVPADADCIQNESTYWDFGNRYFKEGLDHELGGKGPNISYKFKVQELDIDYQSSDREVFVGIETTDTNKSFKNFSSPYNRLNYMGYTRGETYRFGIQFLDLKGRPYYAKWIADIRFPETYEYNIDSYETWTQNIWTPSTHTWGTRYDFGITSWRDGTTTGNRITTARSLGLEFTVDVSALEEFISGYEIVRMDRTDYDKTILGMGLLCPVRKYEDGQAICVETLDEDSNMRWHGPLKNFYLPGPPTPHPDYSYPKHFTFESPDVLMGDISQFSGGTQIQLLGFYGGTELSSGSPPAADPFLKVNKVNYIDTTTNYTKRLTKDISESVILTGVEEFVNPADYSVSIGSISYAPIIRMSTDGILTATVSGKGTHLVGVTSGADTVNHISDLTRDLLGDSGAENNPQIACASIKRVLYNQYGGSNYDNRYSNVYKSCGNPQMLISNSDLFDNPQTFNIFGGDTFVDYFEYHRAYWIDMDNRPGSWDTFFEVAMFPVESTINPQLRTELYWGKNTNENRHLMQERKGAKGTGAGNLFIQDFDLYTYNTVYSTSAGGRIYISEPPYENTQEEHPSRIYRSVEKGLDDISDNWLKFLSDNKLDIDGKNGALTTFANFKNNLIFFQERAFGAVSVNERASTITDATGATLVLGTGGVLDHYVYISQELGINHRFGITNTGSALYLFNNLDRELYQYKGEENTPLGKLYGMASHIHENTLGDINKEDDMLVNKTGLISVYDSRSNRVLFTFKDRYPDTSTTGSYDSGITLLANYLPTYITVGDLITVTSGVYSEDVIIENIQNEGELTLANILNTIPAGAVSITYLLKNTEFTLSFNDLLNVFESLYSYLPAEYLRIDSDILSVPDNNLGHAYIHSKGDKGKFYGTVYDSTVTVLSNKDVDINKMFNNYQINSEVLKNNIRVIPEETITSIKVWNDYQDSGDITLTPGTNIKYKLETWRMAIPRNSSDTGRIRSHSALTKMTFENGSGSTSNNKSLILNSLLTFYHLNMQ